MSVIFKIFRWPILVLALHILATITGSYWYWLRLDNFMHVLGGASIAAASLSAYPILKQKKFAEIRHPLLLIFLVVAVVALAAMLWEFMELGVDTVFEANMQPDLLDTISDMALGLLGGVMVATKRVMKASV